MTNMMVVITSNENMMVVITSNDKHDGGDK